MCKNNWAVNKKGFVFNTSLGVFNKKKRAWLLQIINISYFCRDVNKF
jgi:hypothetical protein